MLKRKKEKEKEYKQEKKHHTSLLSVSTGSRLVIEFK